MKLIKVDTYYYFNDGKYNKVDGEFYISSKSITSISILDGEYSAIITNNDRIIVKTERAMEIIMLAENGDL